jgi:hypothetical protein
MRVGIYPYCRTKQSVANRSMLIAACKMATLANTNIVLRSHCLAEQARSTFSV